MARDFGFLDNGIQSAPRRLKVTVRDWSWPALLDYRITALSEMSIERGCMSNVKAAPLAFPSKDPPVSLPDASLGMQGNGSDKSWDLQASCVGANGCELQ